MIILQKFKVEDIPRLVQWTPDAKSLMQWAGPGYNFPLDQKQVMETFEKTRGKNPAHYMFKVQLVETREIIGHLELMAIDYQKMTGVLGRVLIGESSSRGKGYGKIMIRAALRFGFEELELNEIDLGVFDFNQAARKCYQKLGFKEYRNVQYDTALGAEFATLKRMKLSKADWQQV